METLDSPGEDIFWVGLLQPLRILADVLLRDLLGCRHGHPS
jgi:hypothetical protein